MSILWHGGEDLDFPNGPPVLVSTTAANFRGSPVAYSRCAVASPGSGATSLSEAFPGGAITSCWLTLRGYWGVGASNCPCVGFGKIGTASVLTVGSGSATNKLSIGKFVNGTYTIIASELGASFSTSTLHRLDIQLISYGTTGTVVVYLNGVQVISYPGDLTMAGVSGFDCVALMNTFSSTYALYASEIVVADEDTRLFYQATMAPSAQGDTDLWSGSYTNVNGVLINDASPVFTNTAGQDEQFNLVDPPAATATVKSVRVVARAACSAGATVNNLKLGVKTNAAVNVDAGHALTTAWATYSRLMAQNPVTANLWQQSELAPLQIDLQS